MKRHGSKGKNGTHRACPICGRRRQKDRPVCGKHWRHAPAPVALVFLEALGSDPYDVAAPSDRIRAAAQRVADVVCEILGRSPVELNPTPDVPGAPGAMA